MAGVAFVAALEKNGRLLARSKVHCPVHMIITTSIIFVVIVAFIKVVVSICFAIVDIVRSMVIVGIVIVGIVIVGIVICPCAILVFLQP